MQPLAMFFCCSSTGHSDQKDDEYLDAHRVEAGGEDNNGSPLQAIHPTGLDKESPEIAIPEGQVVATATPAAEEAGAPGPTVPEDGGDTSHKKLSEHAKKFADRFASRSSTSRRLDIDGDSHATPGTCSSLDVVQSAHIDPEKGLRRVESVHTVTGTVDEKYTVVRKLGEGSFGLVMLMHSKSDGKELRAVKSVPVKNLKDSGRFEKELVVSRQLKHPHIVRLYETFREGEKYHLIMEYSDGGDLFEKVQKTRRKKDSHAIMGLQFQQIVQFAWQMLTGIAYLHHYSFAHRDVKPENYLLESQKSGMHVKLIDFGLARKFEKKDKMTSRVGTPHYVAPEVVNNKIQGYTSKCDLWSIGVALWFMSVGELPFVGATQQDILKQVVKGSYNIKPILWEIHGHPQELQELIFSLLVRDFEKRPAAKWVITNNEWLKENGDLSKGEQSKPSTSCCTVS